MPKITITLTDYEAAVLAHKFVNFEEYINHRIKFTEVGNYALSLAEQITKRAIEDSTRAALPQDMSIESIVDILFKEDGYLNAADRASTQAAAGRQGLPGPDYSDIIK